MKYRLSKGGKVIFNKEFHGGCQRTGVACKVLQGTTGVVKSKTGKGYLITVKFNVGSADLYVPLTNDVIDSKYDAPPQRFLH